MGLMGGGFEKTPLNAKVLGSTQMDGFRIEKILFESQPQFFVTALLYLPEGAANPTSQNRDVGHPIWWGCGRLTSHLGQARSRSLRDDKQKSGQRQAQVL